MKQHRLCPGVRAELVLGALERKLGQKESAGPSHEYLQQRLQYDAASERLMDPEDRAVMMAWEGCASVLLAVPRRSLSLLSEECMKCHNLPALPFLHKADVALMCCMQAADGGSRTCNCIVRRRHSECGLWTWPRG